MLIGRFLYGVSMGSCLLWSKDLIKEIVPLPLHPRITWIFTISEYVAMALGYAISVLFYRGNVGRYYIFMFCLPGIFALTQMLLVYFLVPESPRDLFRKKNHEEGRKVLELVYKE